MSKFNNQHTRAALPQSPMTTTGTTSTYEGGAAFVRDAKSELFQLAVVNMVGEDTFYEKAQNRDDRFSALVRQVTLEDPAWTYRFLGWLRNKANMRSASIVVAAEAVKARLDASAAHFWLEDGMPLGSRTFVRQGMARADEPGEFLAYWTSKYGRRLPKPVKRGVADATVALFNEYAYAKYGKGDGYQLADILDLTHPSPKAPWQGELFRYAIDIRHGREALVPPMLPMLQHRDALMALPQAERKAFLRLPDAQERLSAAGITWEALAGWVGGALDASFWESVIPSMGYMALLRNLRNFDKAEISREAARKVADRLADPEQVAKSRQFPFRFLSAYRQVESDRWSTALADALDASVGALPKFPGKTLVLLDTSGSMQNRISEKSTVSHLNIGTLFAVALAKAGNNVDFHGYANGVFRHEIPKGSSILRQVEAVDRKVGSVGHGTETVSALRATYSGHDRVILVTDMQAFIDRGYLAGHAGASEAVPANVPFFGINPSGYKASGIDTSKPNRYEIGGFSDQVFRMVGLLSEGKGENWPF